MMRRTATIAAVALSMLLASQTANASGPCADSINYLKTQYDQDPRTRNVFDLVYKGLQDPPSHYGYANPWKAAGDGKTLADRMASMFATWCTALPEISGSSDNGLDPILYFAWFYYRNPAGQHFVQGRDPADPTSSFTTGTTFLSKFNKDYRAYMDSGASTGEVAQWIADPRIEIEDYVHTKVSDYPSWNSFFARELKQGPDGRYPSRPVTMPDRDYVIVSPTDCIMTPLVQRLEPHSQTVRAYIENPLELDMVLDVKSIPISVKDLLGETPQDYKNKFSGGSGLACVLMPNTYHHFHSPVDGTIVHAEIVSTGSPGTPGTWGYPDFPNWVPMDGNVGRPGTDFSQFQAFQRGVIIIEVTYRNLPGHTPEMLTGYVASIPVGLDSVGSVVLDEGIRKGKDVIKGVTELGNFFYGGSLNILLFSQGMVSPAVQTRMGNQIGIINVGTAPPSPWTPGQ